MDAAERQRKFRARRDLDPIRRQQYLEHSKERYQQDLLMGKKKKVCNMTEDEKEQARERWREVKRQQRIRELMGNDEQLPSTSTNNGTKKSYAARKQKAYRDRKKAKDPCYLRKEADRRKKYFKPRDEMSPQELEESRWKNRIYTKRHRLKKKFLQTAELDREILGGLELVVEEDLDYTVLLSNTTDVRHSKRNRSKVFPVELRPANGNQFSSQSLQYSQNMFSLESDIPVGSEGDIENEALNKSILHRHLGLHDDNCDISDSSILVTRLSSTKRKKPLKRSSRFKPVHYKRKKCHKRGYKIFKICRKILRKYIILEGLRVQIPVELFDEMVESP